MGFVELSGITNSWSSAGRHLLPPRNSPATPRAAAHYLVECTIRRAGAQQVPTSLTLTYNTKYFITWMRWKLEIME